MSQDAVVREALRRGDTLGAVRQLIRAGRGAEALKLRGIVPGDRVERVRYIGCGLRPEIEVGKRGVVSGPDSADPLFVYVIFDEQITDPYGALPEWARGQDQTKWADDGTRTIGGPIRGWPTLIETLALVELYEETPTQESEAWQRKIALAGVPVPKTPAALKRPSPHDAHYEGLGR